MDLSKAVQLASAGASSQAAAVAIEDVFSTYVYTGNGSTQDIVNGINLADDGGMVWIKNRGATASNILTDTERGFGNILYSDLTNAEFDFSASLTSANTDGFSIAGTNSKNNTSANTYTSWTFKNQPRFFQAIKYTGNGVAGREIAHDLGVVPGCIIVKQMNDARNWYVYHKSLGNTFSLSLNSTDAKSNVFDNWNSTTPTDLVFTVGSLASVNADTATYIAYLFADDPLGPSGDGSDGMIACGSYTGTGVAGNLVSLGWEPQFVLIKDASGAWNWVIFDNMRGTVVSGVDSYLLPNSSNAEATIEAVEFNADGFELSSNTGMTNTNGDTFIYIAIRRPMKTPESSSEVFAIDTSGSTDPHFTSGFPVDMGIRVDADYAGHNTDIGARLIQGKKLRINLTDAEGLTVDTAFDHMDGWFNGGGLDTTMYSWMWKRAAGFFDVVCYTGDGVAGRTVQHNLGVVPEMMWVKSRDIASSYWNVYHKALGNNTIAYLNWDYSAGTATNFYNTDPTSELFYTSNSDWINSNTKNYIAFLFATLAGISKCFSFTGNGTTNGDEQTIDCGFSTGSKMVIIKATSTTGNWMLWDSVRGITALSDDPSLRLNTTDAEVTTDNSIEPVSSGFTVRYDTGATALDQINVDGVTYIGYAVAE